MTHSTKDLQFADTCTDILLALMSLAATSRLEEGEIKDILLDIRKTYCDISSDQIIDIERIIERILRPI